MEQSMASEGSVRCQRRCGRRKTWGALPGSVLSLASLLGFVVCTGLASPAHGANSEPHALIRTVQDYARAIAMGDQVSAARLDFACLFKMVQDNKVVAGEFPLPGDPIYEWCASRRETAHAGVIETHDLGLEAIWPGRGRLVDFADFQRFYISETGGQQLAPSFFVMPLIGERDGELLFQMEVLSTARLPHASFRLKDYEPVKAAPTSAVVTRILYKDPMLAPVANAPGTKDWAVPYKKPRGVVRAVTVKWVVLSNLRKHGFLVNHAVLDIPLKGPFDTMIPFVLDAGGFVPKSTEWWGADDMSQALDVAVHRARDISDPRERLMLLNRVLLIDPRHEDALELLADHLYRGLLAYGSRRHGVRVQDERLARRLNELYWTIQSQTNRYDLSLDMQMSDQAEPTPADYLYRMIPIMEALVSLHPGDFETRLRLGLAYRWTNDQMAAISAPQELLTEVPPDNTQLRARILLALAWARIGKVAWNRHFDDPDIMKGFEEAKAAFELTDDPLDKFTAAYAMAYSLAFRVDRDTQAMVRLLREARQWFRQLPGATPEAWAFLLQNDTLKGLVETDPAFKGLLAAS